MKNTIIQFVLLLTVHTLLWPALLAQTQKGADIDGKSAGDLFGLSLSMSDANTIAIGAMGDAGGATNAGNVSIYEWNGSAWVQKGYSIKGDAAYDNSGYSLSMPDNHTVAIGASGNDGNGIDAGNTRIYTWDGNAWVQKGADIQGKAAGEQSGVRVCMPNSNTVAISAPFNHGNGVYLGQVRIYTWSDNGWVQKGEGIDGESNGNFSGSTISMPDSNTVAIGAIFNSGNGPEAGHVRIFAWNGSAWSQKGADIDGEGARDQSGFSLGMPDNNTVAIGAPFNKGNGVGAGQVRIFAWNGSSWAQKGADLDGEKASDHFGTSLSMPDANTVAIGATGSDGNGADAGQVSAFVWNGSTWVRNGSPIDGEAGGDLAGGNVCMPNTNTVAIGAIHNNGSGANAGQVRVYALMKSR